VVLSDFSHVLLKQRDKDYVGTLNGLHRELVQKFGEDYDAFQYFELNRTLLTFYATLKSRCSIGIFTTDTLQNHRQLRPELDLVCDQIFAAKDYGWNKKDSASYGFVSEVLGVSSEEVIYIDDEQGNIDAATKAGMRAFRYRQDDEIIQVVSSLLLNPTRV